MREGARRTALLTALLLCALWALAGCQGAQSADEWMVERALALTGQMAELADSPAYVRMMSASEELSASISQMAAVDAARPEGAVLIDYPADKVLALAAAQSDLTLPEEGNVRLMLERKLSGAHLANLINGRQGATTLAAASLLACSESYVQPKGWPGGTVVVLEYPGDYASLVAFSQSGEGVISASALFVHTGGADLMASPALEGLPELDSRTLPEGALERLLPER